jgi:hypothetical protein
MSKRRKNIDLEPTKAEAKVKSEEMSYKVFFNQSLAKGLVKPWQEREIHAFFKDLGLQDKESLDVYRDALTKY